MKEERNQISAGIAEFIAHSLIQKHFFQSASLPIPMLVYIANYIIKAVNKENTEKFSTPKYLSILTKKILRKNITPAEQKYYTSPPPIDPVGEVVNGLSLGFFGSVARTVYTAVSNKTYHLLPSIVAYTSASYFGSTLVDKAVGSILNHLDLGLSNQQKSTLKPWLTALGRLALSFTPKVSSEKGDITYQYPSTKGSLEVYGPNHGKTQVYGQEYLVELPNNRKVNTPEGEFQAEDRFLHIKLDDDHSIFMDEHIVKIHVLAKDGRHLPVIFSKKEVGDQAPVIQVESPDLELQEKWRQYFNAITFNTITEKGVTIETPPLLSIPSPIKNESMIPVESSNQDLQENQKQPLNTLDIVINEPTAPLTIESAIKNGNIDIALTFFLKEPESNKQKLIFLALTLNQRKIAGIFIEEYIMLYPRRHFRDLFRLFLKEQDQDKATVTEGIKILIAFYHKNFDLLKANDSPFGLLAEAFSNPNINIITELMESELFFKQEYLILLIEDIQTVYHSLHKKTSVLQFLIERGLEPLLRQETQALLQSIYKGGSPRVTERGWQNIGHYLLAAQKKGLLPPEELKNVLLKAIQIGSEGMTMLSKTLILQAEGQLWEQLGVAEALILAIKHSDDKWRSAGDNLIELFIQQKPNLLQNKLSIQAQKDILNTALQHFSYKALLFLLENKLITLENMILTAMDTPVGSRNNAFKRDFLPFLAYVSLQSLSLEKIGETFLEWILKNFDIKEIPSNIMLYLVSEGKKYALLEKVDQSVASLITDELLKEACIALSAKHLLDDKELAILITIISGPLEKVRYLLNKETLETINSLGMTLLPFLMENHLITSAREFINTLIPYYVEYDKEIIFSHMLEEIITARISLSQDKVIRYFVNILKYQEIAPAYLPQRGAAGLLTAAVLNDMEKIQEKDFHLNDSILASVLQILIQEGLPKNRVEAYIQYLVRHKINFSELCWSYGKAFLHSAVDRGEIDIIEVLLKLEPSLIYQSVKNGGGFTALTLANQLGRKEIVEYLINKGANPIFLDTISLSHQNVEDLLEMLGFRYEKGGQCHGTAHTILQCLLEDGIDQCFLNLKVMSNLLKDRDGLNYPFAHSRAEDLETSTKENLLSFLKRIITLQKQTRTHPLSPSKDPLCRSYIMNDVCITELLTDYISITTPLNVLEKTGETKSLLPQFYIDSKDFDLDNLTQLFQSLEKIIKNSKLQHPLVLGVDGEKLARLFSGSAHAIGVSYDTFKKCWFFVDSESSLPPKYLGTSNALAASILSALSDCRDKIHIFALTSTLHLKEVQDYINQWGEVYKTLFPNSKIFSSTEEAEVEFLQKMST